MNNLLVSVLMPAYNAEEYIVEAIESILNQSYKDFELIISDDDSTDRTWDIICSYKNKDQRIIAVKNESNLNIAGNRNKLLSLAKGKYIVWQDADDVSYPYRLEKQVEFMENNEQVGICGGYLDLYANNKFFVTRKYFRKDKALRQKIFKQSPIAQPASIVRAECYKVVGLYNESFPPAEDIDMSFRIGTKYKFANLPVSLIKYRLHSNSATTKKLRYIIWVTLKVRLRYVFNKSYSFSFIDLFYQVVTLFAILLPIDLIFVLFRIFRSNISR